MILQNVNDVRFNQWALFHQKRKIDFLTLNMIYLQVCSTFMHAPYRGYYILNHYGHFYILNKNHNHYMTGLNKSLIVHGGVLFALTYIYNSQSN